MSLLEPLRPLRIRDPRQPVNLIVVGTGGTGGYVVQYLCRLVYALQRTQEFTITITLVDGDRVEDANLLRQHFLPQDVGRPKATVLAERFGAIYQLPILAVPHYLTTVDGLDSLVYSARQDAADRYAPYYSAPLDLILGLVDNHATRQLLDQIFHRLAHLVYIDAGNDGVLVSDDPADREAVRASGYGGHVVVGVKKGGEVVLPPVGTVYPDILTDTESVLPGQACGQQAVSQPQRMITNVWAAMTVLSAVTSILADGLVPWHVANFNAQHATIRSKSLTESYYHQIFEGSLP